MATEKTNIRREFLGINNIQALDRLDDRELREAVNVDIDGLGRIRRRMGFRELDASFTNQYKHSMWAEGDILLYARDDGTGTIRQILPDESRVTLHEGFTTGVPVSFLKLNNEIFWSDGVSTSRKFLVNGTTLTSTTWGTTVIPGNQLTNTSPLDHTEEADLVSVLPGRLLTYWKGRIFGAQGSTVWLTEPMRYDVIRRSTGFSMFPSEIRMMGATDGALFIVADKTYVIRGDRPQDWQRITVSEASAPVHAPAKVQLSHFFKGDDAPAGTGIVWQGDEGMMLGYPDGSVLNLTEKRVALPKYDSASLVFRQEQGLRQVLSVAPSRGTSNGLQFGDSAVAEIIRNGVTVN